jgi:hypothetical protein
MIAPKRHINGSERLQRWMKRKGQEFKSRKAVALRNEYILTLCDRDHVTKTKDQIYFLYCSIRKRENCLRKLLFHHKYTIDSFQLQIGIFRYSIVTPRLLSANYVVDLSMV